MSTAQRIKDAIPVSYEITLDGQKVFETSCSDFDQYKTLPDVVTYAGNSYTKTGWSSDSGRACYKQSTRIAYKT